MNDDIKQLAQLAARGAAAQRAVNKLGAGPPPPTCPSHGRPLICPACAGARGGKVGGKVLSAAKLRQLRRAAKRPRPGARKDPE